VKSLLLLPALLLLAIPAHAALRLPSQPSNNQHVVDLADLITPDDEAQIQDVAQRLWSEEKVYLVVATIDSMAQYGGARMSIEDFADSLYAHWALGDPPSRGTDESRHILLLVSRLDRKARIHMGGGWGYSKDPESWELMNKHLVPAFKRDRYSSGLAYGAAALDRMVRGLSPPRPPLTEQDYALYGGGGALLLFTVVSMVRSGTSGWAWSFWSTVFSILWAILKALLTPSHRRRRSRWGYSSDDYYDSSYSSRSSSSWSSSSSSSSSWSSGSSSSSSSSSRGGGATGSW
jgi:uncharacterized protein